MRAARLGGMAVVALGVCAGCQLRRPDTVTTRMIEPQLSVGTPAVAADKTASVRLLDTHARGHIGRPILHLRPDGELVTDPVWRWSSAPDRYLDTALRLAIGSSPNVRQVDTPGAQALAVTLVAWHLETGAADTRLVGAIQIQLTGTNGAVREEIIRDTEPVSNPLPGDLAAVAGRLLGRLAASACARAAGG
jgi:hypothetical protein